jgi:hypothetical protein
MKTEDLIRALAADSTQPITPLRRHLLGGLLSGLVLAVAVFAATLHPRADIHQALRSPGFVYKLIVTLTLVATAGAVLPTAARPLLPVLGRGRLLLIIAPVLLAAGVAVELYLQPVGLWWPRLVGHNAVHCLSIIPFLSAAPALCILLALRHGAPARPAFAGAIAGLTAGGLGAVLYALTCPDDSPLFVATWYTIAIAVVTNITAYVGSRSLRW